MNTAYQILTKAKSLIDTPEKWAVGLLALGPNRWDAGYGREYDGEVVDPIDPTACKFCSIGAVARAAFDSKFFDQEEYEERREQGKFADILEGIPGVEELAACMSQYSLNPFVHDIGNIWRTNDALGESKDLGHPVLMYLFDQAIELTRTKDDQAI